MFFVFQLHLLLLREDSVEIWSALTPLQLYSVAEFIEEVSIQILLELASIPGVRIVLEVDTKIVLYKFDVVWPGVIVELMGVVPRGMIGVVLPSGVYRPTVIF